MKPSKSHKYNFDNRNKLFWLFQFLYWFAHWLINIIVYPDFLQKTFELIDLSLTIFWGFCLSLVLRYIYKKYSFHKFSLVKLVTLTILSSIITGFIFIFGGLLITYALSGFKQISEIKNATTLIRYIWLNTYPFVVWSALYSGYKIWEEWDLQRINTEKEHALAQSAQIEMLRYQLNPHFLFNTLSSLRALIRIDRIKAEEMVTKISEFLRYSLSYENNHMVPLSKEIEIIKNYLDIEKVRFGDKLYIEYKVDQLAEDYPIPVFLIHPLIENAVKHGMHTSVMPLKIIIAIEVIEDSLIIDVTNSGKWIDEDSPFKNDGTGRGLENIKKRLEFYYPQYHEFNIIKKDDSVTAVIKVKTIINGNHETV